MKSLDRHLWYLTPQLVVLSLTNDDIPTEQLKEMADVLISTPRPEVFRMGKPEFPTGICFKDTAWPEDGSTPRLSSLIKPESWLIFHHLQMSESDVSFLKQEVHLWDSQPGYQKLSQFIENLSVVNDPAERACGLIKVRIFSF